VGPTADDHQNGHEKEDDVGDGGFVAAGVIDADNDHEHGDSGGGKTGNNIGREKVDGQDQADGEGDFKESNDRDESVAHAREVKSRTEGMHDGVAAMSEDFAEAGEQEQARHKNLRRPKDAAHG